MDSQAGTVIHLRHWFITPLTNRWVMPDGRDEVEIG